MGQIFSELFQKNHFVMPSGTILRPLLIMFGILIAVFILLCCVPQMRCIGSKRAANGALSAQQNGGAGGAIELQNAADFRHNGAKVDPGNSAEAPQINPPDLRNTNLEHASYSKSISINDSEDETYNSYYATIRPRTENSCRLPKFIGPSLCSGRRSSGPLNVSTLKENKKVRYANRSVAGPSNVRQGSIGPFGGDELNAEELNYDLFRNPSNTDVMGSSSACGRSKVNAAYVSEITADEPIIPPVDYEEPFIPPVDYEEPFIPPVDYSSDESMVNVERMSRSEYVVDGASEVSEDLNLCPIDDEDKLDDSIEEAIGSLDEVLEAASLPTSVILEPEEDKVDSSSGGVKIIKMIPKK